MNGSHLMGLDSVSTEIYTIHGYFHWLMFSPRTPGFLGCHINGLDDIYDLLDFFMGSNSSKGLTWPELFL